MFYTLSTWAVWMAGAALIGVVMGWLLRSVRPRVVTVIKEVSVEGTPRGSRRPAAVEADEGHGLVLGDELPSDRTLELERVRDEAESLGREAAAWKAEAERQTERAVRAERAAASAVAERDAQASVVQPEPAVQQRTVAADAEPTDVAAVRSERDQLAVEVATLRSAVQEMRVRLWNADAQIAALRDTPGAG